MLLIEFIGINGAGKSYLSNFVYRELKNRHKTLLGPQSVHFAPYSVILSGLLSKVGLKSTNRNPRLPLLSCHPGILASFIQQNREFFHACLCRNARHSHPQRNLWRMLSICQSYQYIKGGGQYQYLIFDEGFCSNGSSYLSPGEEVLSVEEQIIIQKQPEVDLLFHLKAEPVVCAHRIKNRKGGIPIELVSAANQEAFVLQALHKRGIQISKFLQAFPYPERIIEVDAHLPIKIIERRVRDVLNSFLPPSRI